MRTELRELWVVGNDLDFHHQAMGMKLIPMQSKQHLPPYGPVTCGSSNVFLSKEMASHVAETSQETQLGLTT